MALEKNTKVVEALLDQGCEVKKPNYVEDAALMYAVEACQIDKVHFLLAYGANP